MRLSIIAFFLGFSFNISWAQARDFEEVNFVMADSIAEAYVGSELMNLPKLSYNLTHSLTSDVEKFRAIYTWVSRNITNDVNDYLLNKRKREKYQNDADALELWNKEFVKESFRKLLKYKRTVCTGYAYLVKELAYFAGIESVIVDGYGRTSGINLMEKSIPNHSWNAVKLDGKWYLCDATWSSGGMLPSAKFFVPDYNDGYFLADPKLFSLSHYPLDKKWILTEKEKTFDEFISGPLVYKYAFSYDVMPLVPSVMKKVIQKHDSVTFGFQLGDMSIVDKLSLEVARGNSPRSYTPEIVVEENGMVTLNHVFSSKGTFDVHLKVDDDYLATYVVEVKRIN